METNRRYCSFVLDGLLLGVEVPKLQEVLRHQEMTRIPLAPPVLRGLINLRGRIIPALELRRRLGLRERPTDRQPVNLVVRTEAGTVSLLVDEIQDILEVTEDAFERSPQTLASAARELIEGAYKLEDRLLLILDVEKAVDLTADREPGPERVCNTLPHAVGVGPC